MKWFRLLLSFVVSRVLTDGKESVLYSLIYGREKNKNVWFSKIWINPSCYEIISKRKSIYPQWFGWICKDLNSGLIHILLSEKIVEEAHPSWHPYHHSSICRISKVRSYCHKSRCEPKVLEWYRMVPGKWIFQWWIDNNKIKKQSYCLLQSNSRWSCSFFNIWRKQ